MMRRKLRRARLLTAEDWALVARAYAALLDARLALRRMSCEAVLARLEAPADALAVPEGRIARLVAAVDIAARNQLLAPAPCLPRALALCRLLHAEGVVAEVCIGVRRSGGTLLAHAWVESGARVIGDRPDVATIYRPLVAEAHLPPGVVIAGPARDASGDARRRTRALEDRP
jgi:hypothetical protein